MISRFLLLIALATSSQLPLRAEGLASITPITVENAAKLPYHSLKVGLKSQRGMTTVSLHIQAGADTPYSGCSVTILREGGPADAIARFDVASGSPLPVSFEVADELVGQLQIRYHLQANDAQGHYFTIDGPTLRKLVKGQTAKP
ncbi:hypothetical protein [Haloferula sp. BvORR071]|uniref:hypothetical protein n=1 Tax=Haloferula sp. BvORR071 TaxID=1396141 RepID=UPI0005596138|nr:hypothetical protein [Haloferula sp. BvORR071]